MSGHSIAARIAIWSLALGLVLVLPVIAISNGWIGRTYWPLRTLRINDGLQRVDTALIRQRLIPYTREGYFAIRLERARAALAQLPWVETVTVRKHWPDVLEIDVREHRPLARWGQAQVLSESGAVFAAGVAPLPADLPRLHGPEGRIDEMIALYRQANGLFAAADLYVEQLTLDARGSWQLVLTGGIEVMLGRHDAAARLQRFARLLPQLSLQHPAPLLRADLRYRNGVALAWESGA